MPKMSTRFTESNLRAIMAYRVRSPLSAKTADATAAPNLSRETERGETEGIGGRINAPAHIEKGGLVMLPYPISANRYFRNFRGRMVISSEARAYKKQVAWTFSALGIKPASDDVSLTVKLHPKLTTKGVASRTLIDLDNALKVVFDALQGVLYVNDKQVKKLTAEVGEPVLGGGLSVGINHGG